MKKSEKIIYYIIYYRIPQLILFGLILWFFHVPLFTGFCHLTRLTDIHILYTASKYIFYIGLLFVYVLSTAIFLRNKIYYQFTNRHYMYDHRTFQKTFMELIRFYSKSNPYRIRPQDFPIKDWHTADGVILCKYKDNIGKYHLLTKPSSAPGNLITFGLPGCGKSTTQATPTALRFQGGVFAISIKGDLLNFVKGKRKNIKVFTPDKAEGSCHYNPLEGVMNMDWTDRRKFAENISINICPDEPGDNSVFFVGGSRDFLAGIILYLLHLHDTKQRSGNLYFPEIIEYILSTNVFDTTLAIQNCGCSVPGEYTNGYIGSSEKNCAGIWSHLCKQIRPFNTGALRILFDGQGDCITPDDLNHSDIYIDVPQDKYQIYSSAMRLIVSQFLEAFMRRTDVSSKSSENVIPVLFLLDEAALLKLEFSTLSNSLASLRSKKISLFLLCQSIHQMTSIYGENQAHQILDLCQYISVFNAQDPSSRTYFQQLIGKEKTLKVTTSLSAPSNTNEKHLTKSRTVSETEQYIFNSSDFGNLNTVKKGKTIKQVLVYANGKYILGETTPCYE